MKHTVELIKLKNGAKGLFINVPDASVTSFDFNFRAGDYLSPKGKWDTAHVLEHMVLGANKRFRTATEFSKEFDKNGAYNNASTGSYHMSYVAECADFETERILDLLCLSIEAPLLLKSEFIAEKANVQEELKSRGNNHFNELSLELGMRLGIRDLTYSERAKQLSLIKLEDVKNLYQETHTTTNLRFLICGNISKLKQGMINRIEVIELKKGSGRIDLPDEKVQTLKEPVYIKNETLENIYYRLEIVHKNVLKEEELDAENALMSILFGSMHSRVFGVAREQGLVYGINYGDYRASENSIFWIGGQVLPTNIEKLFQLFITEIKAIAAGKITDDELHAAKQSALGSFKRSTQTVGSLLNGYIPYFVYKDEIEEYFKIPERINSVSLNSIINAAKEVLSLDNKWGLGFSSANGKVKADKLYKQVSSIFS